MSVLSAYCSPDTFTGPSFYIHSVWNYLSPQKSSPQKGLPQTALDLTCQIDPHNHESAAQIKDFHGVPQGSVVFLPMDEIARKSLNEVVKGYADDTQLYVPAEPDQTARLLSLQAWLTHKGPEMSNR